MNYILTSLIIILPSTMSHHIMIVFPLTLKSSLIQLSPIIEALLERNHQVTGFFSLPTTINHLNYTEVLLEPLEKDYYQDISWKVLRNEVGPNVMSFKTITSAMGDSYNIENTYKLIKNYDQVESVMKNNSFDALMTPAYYANGFFYLAQVFDVPVIVFSLEGPVVGLYGHMGNPDNPSWQVSNYAPLVEPLSFSDRVYNFFNKYLILEFQRYHLSVFRRHLEKRYNTCVPDLQELEAEVEIRLCLDLHQSTSSAGLSPALLLTLPHSRPRASHPEHSGGRGSPSERGWRSASRRGQGFP